MSGGSSDRPSSLRSLKTIRSEIDRVFKVGSTSCPIALHRRGFDLSSSHSKVARSNKRKRERKREGRNSSVEQKFYLAASRWAKVNEEENIRLEVGQGNKTSLSKQCKYVQKFQQSQRVEGAGR